jgi:hypothetical protein
MTARYLMVDGDTRLTGPTFNYKVVTTSDERMQGKLVIALGYPDQTEGTLNPIHFGYMLWSVGILFPVFFLMDMVFLT